MSRSARKPTASSLLKSVWRTQRVGFSPRTIHWPFRSTIVNSSPHAGLGARAEHDARGLGLRRGGALGRHDLGHRERQLAKAVMARGGDLVDVEPARLEVGADESGDLARVGNVDLVEGDEARTVVETPVGGELAPR